VDFLYSVVGFLIAIGVLVAVHEFGHFWVARKLGVKVLRYSIGFGKPLWQKVHGEDQIEYVIAAIPLGGYVKMLGDDGETPVAENERHRAFDNQPIWKRSLIVLAGPGINFLFAILLFLILGLMGQESLTPKLGAVPVESSAAKAGIRAGDQMLAVDGKEYQFFGQHDLYLFNQVLKGENFSVQVSSDGQDRDVEIDVSGIPIYNINPSFLTRTLGFVPISPEITTTLARVLENTPAAKAGLQKGDTIVSIDGVSMADWRDLVRVISASPEQELAMVYRRDDVIRTISITPAATGEGTAKEGRLGIGPVVKPYASEQIVNIDRSLWQAFTYGVEQTWLMSSVTLRMLWKMVTLQVSHKNISGPITIADVAGDALQISFDYYLHILAVISISLGVMNLLPIPMLDGGHLMMYVVEVVAGKNASQRVFEVGQRVGVLLLICLMSLAFYNDIFRLLN
jgi:regulator of sigma E protease